MPVAKPVLFFAFANDRSSSGSYLRNLPEEARQLQLCLDQAAQQIQCEVVVRQNATLDDILRVFRDSRYRNRIVLFHYGGHAGSFGLLLETPLGDVATAHAEGLTAFLGRQRGLHTVFLNGCSTEEQSCFLLQAGIPLVIATNQAIDDLIATEFAAHFYQALAGGASVEESFDGAHHAIESKTGGVTRDIQLLWHTPTATNDPGQPWAIYVQPDYDDAKKWTLASAAQNPYVGLPQLPQEIGLPNDPYIGLKRFEREHARIFFGRGWDIRELFKHLAQPESDPLLLFYGQTGVGKSSLLDAGLLPRLEQIHTVVYQRRTPNDGLLGGLSKALGMDCVDSNCLRESWLSKEAANGRPLTVLLDQVEEAFTQLYSGAPWPVPAQLDATVPQAEIAVMMTALQDILVEPGKRPQGKLILAFRKERFAEIEDAVKVAAIPYTPYFLKALDRLGIQEAVTGVASGQGPDAERLRAKYKLEIMDAERLPVMIADDLHADPESPIAVTLQILLKEMWEAAVAQDRSAPRFSEALYQKQRRAGLLLNNFLDRQLAQVRAQLPEASESGLVMDLLYHHTTELGTAHERNRDELAKLYPHRADLLTDVLQSLTDHYLLVDASATSKDRSGITRLAHDTLAPLLRQRFTHSPLPGQRAHRLLVSRVGTPENPLPKPAPMDERDLQLVEAGQPGMRAWYDKEVKLVEESRAAARDRERSRRRTTRIGIGLVALIIGLGIASGVLGIRANVAAQDAFNAEATAQAQATRANLEADRARAESTRANQEAARAEAEAANAERARAIADANAAEAKLEANRALANTLVARTQGILDQEIYDPSLALLLSMEAVRTTLAPDGYIHPTADQNLLNTISQVKQLGWRTTLPKQGHTGALFSAVFADDGNTILTASEDQTARLWDAATGNEVLKLAGHHGAVRDAQFSPSGSTIATAGTDGTLRIWDETTGEQISSYQVHSDTIRSLAFSPDGKHIVTASADGTARVWDVSTGKKVFDDFVHDGGIMLSADFSPDGNLIVVTGAVKQPNGHGALSLWDATIGELIVALPYTKWVRNAAFTPDGRQLVAVNADGTVRVWNVNDGAEIEEIDSWEAHDHELSSIAFSRDGHLAVTAGSRGEIYIRDALSGRALHKITGHDGDADSVIAAGFSPDGALLVTAGDDHTLRLWDAETGDELHVIGRHTGDIRAAAFSPDGKLIATGSGDTSIILWDAESALAVQTLREHTDTVRSLAFSPDGKLLATAGEDATVRLWEMNTRVEIASLQGFTSTVMSVAFSPDGSRIVAAGEPFHVIIWEVESGQMLNALSGHTDTVRAAVYSPDGLRILTGSDDGSARLWDAQSGAMLAEYRGHTDGVLSVAFSPNGQTIATGSRDHSVILWDVESGNLRAVIPAHTENVDSVLFSPDGELLLTASSDRSALLLNVDTGDPIRRLLGHDGAVRAAVFSPDGATIVTASADRSARLWDTVVADDTQGFDGHSGLVRYAAFSPDDSLLVSAGEDRVPRLWDVETTEELAQFTGHEHSVWSAEFNRDGDAILTASQDGTIRLWPVKMGQVVITATWAITVSDPPQPVNYAGFSPDGTLMVTASSDRIARLWDTATLTVVKELRGHSRPVLTAAFSADGALLATSSGDGDNSARIWDVATGKQLHLLAHNDWVWFVAFSLDGTELVTAAGDGIARVWGVNSGEEQMSLGGHVGLVRTAQFSPDGRFILTAGEDGTARLWDAINGQQVRQFTGHDDDAWYAGFNHDGRLIVTASFDQTLRLWDTHIEDTATRATLLIQRDPPIFTVSESDFYQLN
jgi:WD40 repeat protein